MDGLKVLERLKEYDSIYEAGFTVSGTRQSKDVILRRSLRLDVKRRWRLTFGGDRIVGYIMQVTDYEKPKYQKPKQSDRFKENSREPSEKDRKKDETLRIAVRTKQWGYWGSDVSGNHYEDTILEVTPTNEVTEIGKAQNSSLFGPRDEGPNAPRRVILWSLGRFFSKHLNKVTRVDKAADGRLLVTALGKKDEQQPGRWELEIEPDAAWMVRKARFYWDFKPDRIEIEMTNEGTVWSGSHCIPKAAVCNYWGPIAADPKGMEERLTFEPVVEKFDEKLYSDTQQAVAHNDTPSLTVHDYRVSPPQITEPFRPKPEPEPPAPASPRRMWFFIVNLILLIGVFIFFVVWKRQSKTAQRSL